MKRLLIPYLLPVLLGNLLVLGLSGIQNVQAETRYVTDMLYLSLRGGPGNEYSVIETLRSNAPVEVLEEEGKFLKIRTEDGKEEHEHWVTHWVSPNSLLLLNTPHTGARRTRFVGQEESCRLPSSPVLQCWPQVLLARTRPSERILDNVGYPVIARGMHQLHSVSRIGILQSLVPREGI